MARRTKDNAVDWDAIERQYRLGQKSNKQLGEEFGVDHSSVGRRAKRYGWVVDKAAEVTAVANALLIQNATGNANPNATPSALEIKAAGQAQADVVLLHRRGLRRLAGLRDTMLDELGASSSVDGQHLIARMHEIVYGSDEEDSKRAEALRRELNRALSLSGRVDDLRKLAEIDERVRRGEREAFGMDDKGGGAPMGDIRISF